MKCIIIEDQAPAQRLLKKYIGDVESLELLATFSNAISALDFLQRETVDLIFLDIHLPKISGMDFLRSLPQSPYIILTTAFPDYALESYDFRVIDYLLKPISFQRFVKALSKLPRPAAPNDPPAAEAPTPRDSFFIKSGYEHVRVEQAAICYLKSDADYTEIVTAHKRYLSSESLRHWLEHKLAPQQFVQIHKSYIVNIGQIEKVAGNQIHLHHGEQLPLGRAFKDDFLRRILGQ
ncbi:MAG: LytTR family DNA-binding domain-containing protein [Bacteroidota bacterium]